MATESEMKLDDQTTALKIWIRKYPFVLWKVDKDDKGGTRRVDVTNRFERGWSDSDHFRWFVPNGNYLSEQGYGDDMITEWAEVKDGSFELSPAIVPESKAEKGTTIKNILADQRKKKSK